MLARTTGARIFFAKKIEGANAFFNEKNDGTETFFHNSHSDYFCYWCFIALTLVVECVICLYIVEFTTTRHGA